MTETQECIELERWAPTRDETLAWLSIMLIAFVPIGALFASVASLTSGTDTTALRLEPASFLLFVALMVLIFLLHEGIHGAGVVAFGKRPRFGAGLMHGLPYLSTTADATFPRDQFVAIALAPLVGISILGVALMFLVPSISAWLIFPLALNALGAIGDLALTRVALGYPRDIFIHEQETGITVLGPASSKRQPRSSPRPDAGRERFIRASARVFPVVLPVTFVVEFALVVLVNAAGASSLELPGFVVVSGGDSPRFSAGLFGPLVLALGLAAAFAAVTARRS